ncbi:hypothetical protein E2C01_068057 [Portunus trituberculatus]|uniref:Uncharacterized protein n=1 Tax=Portunus trituberculatus TaxID=210409 RepID=A0A5B7HVC8_PORTR|nr:hypothetical protein [Portunus trituberculatus]
MPSRSIHAIVLRDVAPRHPKLVSGYGAKVLTCPALPSLCGALEPWGRVFVVIAADTPPRTIAQERTAVKPEYSLSGRIFSGSDEMQMKDISRRIIQLGEAYGAGLRGTP